MKFASLVFLLVPFVANAADLCVEDNILKCKELGYTESSCPYGGVACQYDTSLWYCAKWTCADGRLYSAKNKPAGVKCIETSYKDMDCYDCELGYETAGCEDGYVDIDGDCKKIYETCSAYNSSYQTSNTGYCGCTKVSGLYNSNKEELTCYSDCKAICDASFKYVTAPENSVLSGTSCTGYAGTSASSCSGTSAKRYTYFTCNEGYVKNAAGTACEVATCNSGCATDVAQCGDSGADGWTLGENCNLSGTSQCKKCNKKDCPSETNTGWSSSTACNTAKGTIGWTSAATSDYNGDAVCYSCSCSYTSTECPYTDANKGEATISDKCCNGQYKTCKSNCVAVTVPQNAHSTATCSGCGQTVDTAWACNDGYTKNGNVCEVATCPTGSSTTYTSKEACKSAMGYSSTTGVSFAKNGSYSGANPCYACACSCDTSTYKWDNSNKGNATLGDQCCNGKYKTCTSGCSTSTYPLTGKNVANAATYSTCTGCGVSRYALSTCNNGYCKSGSTCYKYCSTSTYAYYSGNKPSNSTLSGSTCSGARASSTSSCSTTTSYTNYSSFTCNSGYCKSSSACKKVCNASTYPYTTAPANASLSGNTCTGYAGTSASSCSGTLATRYTDFTCNSGYCKNSAGTACVIPSGCAIGDVFYADGSCSSVDDYDSNKTAVGVVYALSATKGGVPYTTAEAEAECFRAEHGRVINLRDLTSDSSTYAFDPTNPYDNSYAYLYFGLYDTDVSGLTNYSTSALMLTALQNDEEELYSGKENTQKFASATPTYSDCTNGTYTKGTANYNKYCAPTAANAALSFYPPEVSKTHATVGAGNWYLPAIGELALLYGFDKNTVAGDTGTSGATGTTKAKVNKTLTALKSKGVDATIFTMTNNYYWTSVEYDSKHSWILYMRNGGRQVGNRDVSNYYVRVSLEF